jgi:hypothetical protein
MKAIFEARESFWAFRQYLNPKMKKGWWQRQVALELHQFWIDYPSMANPFRSSTSSHGYAAKIPT